ncbi:hypothetical protein BDR03DRAFT_949644 [Suillus americanus]|nr:hypothetical protein BDR03DRAFT_949644 [Suillus americanus]
MGRNTVYQAKILQAHTGHIYLLYTVIVSPICLICSTLHTTTPETNATIPDGLVSQTRLTFPANSASSPQV